MKIREFTFIPEDRDKPIRMVYEDDFKVIQTSDCTIETVRRLTPMESEKLLKNMFGTTDVGILDCSDMSDEEINRIVDEFNSVGCTSFVLPPKEIKEIMDRCKKRYKEDIRDECYNCIWFDNDTGERHCTANKNP